MKSELIAAVSHDLKSPLAVAMGFAELLIDEPGLSPVGRQCVEGILSSLMRMRTLVEDVLDLTQIEAGLREGVGRSEVSTVIAEVVRDLQPLAAWKQQSLTTSLLPVPREVQIGPVRLGRVVRNLVDNAIKYAPTGGHVHIKAETRGGKLFVQVQDDGPGIPRAAQSRLFERFYRAGSPNTMAREGTGLGLFFVRTIVEDSGGAVGVQSGEEQGSIFWFWLPLKDHH